MPCGWIFYYRSPTSAQSVFGKSLQGRQDKLENTCPGRPGGEEGGQACPLGNLDCPSLSSPGLLLCLVSSPSSLWFPRDRDRAPAASGPPPPTRRFRGPPWSSAEWRGGSLRTCVTSPCPLPSGRGSGGHTLLPLLLLCLPQIATTSFSAGYSGSSFPKRPQFFPSESPGSPKALFWRGEPNGTGTLRTSLASSLMGVKKNPDPTSPHP